MPHLTKDDLYTKKEMKKGKRHWGFTCPGCKEKKSSKTDSEYYVFDECLITLDRICLFCSPSCIFDYLESINEDIDSELKRHNEAVAYMKELDKMYEMGEN